MDRPLRLYEAGFEAGVTVQPQTTQPKRATDKTVTYQGEVFGLSEEVAFMVVADFMELAEQGVDSETAEGFVAIKNLLRQFIVEDDWKRFHALSIKSRDTGEKLMEVIKDAMVALSENPTQSPSDSSDGQPLTAPSSTGGSSSPVTRQLEQRGRPDLALIVTEAIEAREARAS